VAVERPCQPGARHPDVAGGAYPEASEPSVTNSVTNESNESNESDELGHLGKAGQHVVNVAAVWNLR
jgi:hypothetical protein